MKRSLTLTTLLAVLASLLAIPGGYCDEPAIKKSSSGIVLAQADEKTKKQETKKTRKKPRGRLPNNYGKIGLSNEQKTEIYAVQAKYRVQLKELADKIAAIRSEQQKAIDSVLTEEQMEKLTELLEASKKKRASAKRK